MNTGNAFAPTLTDAPTTDASQATAPIPLVDLHAISPQLRGDIVAAIGGCLDRCDFVLGDSVTQFERAFATFCRTAECVGVGSGTDAIHLACRAAGIGEGDEVIIPAFTFVATALGVSLSGATPVLVDVCPETGLMDPQRVADAITDRTQAVMPVHLYGQCADMDAINNIATTNDLFVIEDAAQAHGATYKGRPAGSLGKLGCFSFYPSKNLGACGDGGAVTTSDNELASRLRLLRNWGSHKKYHHEQLGLNSRLDTIQAAVLQAKLKHLNDWNDARRKIADRYHALLADRDDLLLPVVRADCGHAYHLFVIRCDDRDERLSRLNASGIGAGIHYPFAVHQLGAYRCLGYANGTFPHAEALAASCLSLPMYPQLREDQIDRVVNAL